MFLSLKNSLMIVLIFTVACDNNPSQTPDVGPGHDSDIHDRDTDYEQIDADHNESDSDELDSDIEEQRLGLVRRIGEATASTTEYQGHEELILIADEGDGEEVCKVRLTFTSQTTPRQDCNDCEWAFDLEISEATIVTDSTEGSLGCHALLGFAPEDIGDLNGTVRSYGYIEEYMSHGNVLVLDDGSGNWSAVCFASWNHESHEFTYTWEIGVVPF